MRGVRGGEVMEMEGIRKEEWWKIGWMSGV